MFYGTLRLQSHRIKGVSSQLYAWHLKLPLGSNDLCEVICSLLGSSAIGIKLTTTLESYVSHSTRSRSYLIEINHENKRAMTHLPPSTMNLAKFVRKHYSTLLLTIVATFYSSFTHYSVPNVKINGSKRSEFSYSGVRLIFYTFSLSPIEIGLFWVKITYVKSHSNALSFDPQTDMK